MAGLFGISAFWISPEHETLSSMFQTACCFALFVLCTVETNDFFRSKMLHQTIQYIESLQFTRLMVLSAVWGLLALPMGWLGISKKLTPVLYSSWGILILSTCLAAVRGIQYDPIASYSLILNLRVGALLFVLGALVVYQRMLKAPQNTMEWVPEVLHAIQISIVGIILVLLTGETRDFFEQQINSTQASGEVFQHLHNLEQLSLSAVWLLYSVALMAIGFWRSLRGIRIIAFVLFGITILKIFIYDLSSLDTLYRIFSFIGLGLILLAVSYAYQRYKDIIFGKKE
jgi:uncharacterized membrane protein